jgi:SAM-dependent methyltransferase
MTSMPATDSIVDTTLLTSGLCTQAQLESPAFQAWGARLGQSPRHLHRKVWEYCFICQALDERQMLREGSRGLGFAVGQEPLAAMFASLGCQVLATDLPTEEAAKAGWVDTNQHAASLEGLNQRKLCPDDRFKELVSFQFADMRKLTPDLGPVDFIWSACSFEHLGTLEEGLQFVLQSVRLLKPGGVAVHTTEYNVSSNTTTIDDGGVVIYRRSDIEDVAARLRAAGYSVDLDFSDGQLPGDLYVDKHPYKGEVHLKLDLWGYAATSYGLIIRAPAA